MAPLVFLYFENHCSTQPTFCTYMFSFHIQLVENYSILGRLKLIWVGVHCQKLWESKESCCAEWEEALNRGLAIRWSLDTSQVVDPMKRQGATANKTTYDGDSFKYSKPLEEHCSHWLKCEMMCGEIARGNITIITGSSQEDIDLEDSC